MGEISTSSPTFLSVVRQWPVASNIAETLPAGSLINLARTSSSLREALHGFGPLVTGEPENHSPLDDTGGNVRLRKELHLGNHRTPYWEGLKKIAPFTCSSKTHTKGDKTRSCLYCSTPICESCVVKHSFGKSEHTFKNRCRFMCRSCWDKGNPHRERRYSGRWDAAAKYSYKSASQARDCCTCTSRDGWVCNDCKDKQNAVANGDGSKVCFGENCGMILEEDKDRRRICLWCDKPIPRGRASFKSRIAFDHKFMDIREREMSSQLADFQEYDSNRRRHMTRSRRDMRGDEAVKDDPDADVPQFLRNLDVVNYQRFPINLPTGDEIYASKHGLWRYNENFLTCFRETCLEHKDATLLQSITSAGSPEPSRMDTNAQRRAKMRARMGRLADNCEETSDINQHSSEGAKAHREDNEEDEEDGKELEDHDDSYDDCDDETDMIILGHDEILGAQKGTDTQPQSESSNTGAGPPQIQPGEEPPEYGADTLILESGDAMHSD